MFRVEGFRTVVIPGRGLMCEGPGLRALGISA